MPFAIQRIAHPGQLPLREFSLPQEQSHFGTVRTGRCAVAVDATLSQIADHLSSVRLFAEENGTGQRTGGVVHRLVIVLSRNVEPVTVADQRRNEDIVVERLGPLPVQIAEAGNEIGALPQRIPTVSCGSAQQFLFTFIQAVQSRQAHQRRRLRQTFLVHNMVQIIAQLTAVKEVPGHQRRPPGGLRIGSGIGVEGDAAGVALAVLQYGLGPLDAGLRVEEPLPKEIGHRLPDRLQRHRRVAPAAAVCAKQIPALHKGFTAGRIEGDLRREQGRLHCRQRLGSQVEEGVFLENQCALLHRKGQRDTVGIVTTVAGEGQCVRTGRQPVEGKLRSCTGRGLRLLLPLDQIAGDGRLVLNGVLRANTGPGAAHGKSDGISLQEAVRENRVHPEGQCGEELAACLGPAVIGGDGKTGEPPLGEVVRQRYRERQSAVCTGDAGVKPDGVEEVLPDGQRIPSSSAALSAFAVVDILSVLDVGGADIRVLIIDGGVEVIAEVDILLLQCEDRLVHHADSHLGAGHRSPGPVGEAGSDLGGLSGPVGLPIRRHREVVLHTGVVHMDFRRIHRIDMLSIKVGPAEVEAGHDGIVTDKASTRAAHRRGDHLTLHQIGHHPSLLHRKAVVGDLPAQRSAVGEGAVSKVAGHAVQIPVVHIEAVIVTGSSIQITVHLSREVDAEALLPAGAGPHNGVVGGQLGFFRDQIGQCQAAIGAGGTGDRIVKRLLLAVGDRLHHPLCIAVINPVPGFLDPLDAVHIHLDPGLSRCAEQRFVVIHQLPVGGQAGKVDRICLQHQAAAVLGHLRLQGNTGREHIDRIRKGQVHIAGKVIFRFYVHRGRIPLFEIIGCLYPCGKRNSGAAFRIGGHLGGISAVRSNRHRHIGRRGPVKEVHRQLRFNGLPRTVVALRRGKTAGVDGLFKIGDVHIGIADLMVVVFLLISKARRVGDELQPAAGKAGVAVLTGEDTAL